MQIISLQAENIKRLIAVEIKPDGALVLITGRNNQGKTSILDCIWWAIAGARHLQPVPIRAGADEALIRLDLGDIVVTRKFRQKDGDKFTTTVEVVTAEGAKYSSPQQLLDGLFGALTFDPLAYTRLDAKEQLSQLRKLLPDIDFEAFDKAQAEDFDARTEINREAKRLRAQAEAIKLPAVEAPQPIDEPGLVAALEEAGTRNAALQAEKTNRELRKQRIAQLDLEREGLEERAVRLRAELEQIEGEISAKAQAAVDAAEQLSALPPLGEQIDTASIRVAIDHARQHNAAIAQWARKSDLEREALQKEVAAGKLTKAMADRAAILAQLVQKAELPVKGLALGNGEVLLNGLPLSQASGAEQLRLSMAIAMAGNPKLRVLRIKEGSLLDDEGLRIVAEMAEAEGFQVWIERVDSSGKVGFVIENGELRQPMLEAAE